VTGILDRAFSARLHASVSAAFADLPQPAYPPVGSITSSNSHEWPAITVDDERVEIPYRIYNEVPAPDPAPTGSQVAVAIDCLYTRHHDGSVRQRALHRVLASDESWVIPFVLQLLGEYVIEICEDIDRFAQNDLPQRPAMRRELHSFAESNPDFIVLTQRRATSYWACYYRRPHLYRDTYPGLHALELMVDRPA
jgi:hypothetical protein